MTSVYDAIKLAVPERDRTYFFNPTSSSDNELDLRDSMHRVNVVIDLSGGVNATVILPNVAEASGVPYSIRLANANLKSVTITTYGATDWTNITLDADDESVTVMSDGLRYNIIESNYA